MLGQAAAESHQLLRAESHYKIAWQLGNEYLENWPNDRETLQTKSELELEMAALHNDLGNEQIGRQWLQSSRESVNRLLKANHASSWQRSQCHKMLSQIAFRLDETQTAKKELMTAVEIIENRLQEDPTNYDIWRKLWSYSTEMIRMSTNLTDKRSWLEKSKDIILRSAQNIDTQTHPEFFQWMRSAEETLVEEEKLLETKS